MVNKTHFFTIQHLDSLESMATHYPLIRQLYPKLTEDVYKLRLSRIIPSGYQQIGVYQDNKCLGIAGYKLEEELYRGRMIRVEDLIVDANIRSSGAGSALLAYIKEQAVAAGCENIVLESLDHQLHSMPLPPTPLSQFYLRNGFCQEGGAFCFPVTSQAA